MSRLLLVLKQPRAGEARLLTPHLAELLQSQHFRMET